MGIEAATFISQLVDSNPLGADDRATSDDHHRLIKAVLLATLPNFSAAVTPTPAEINKLTGLTTTAEELEQLAGNTVGRLGVAGRWTKQQTFQKLTVDDQATLVWDLDIGQTAEVVLQGNRTLGNPTNIQDGGTYILVVSQDSTGGRTLSYGSLYKWAAGVAPILTTTGSAVDVLSFVAHGGFMLGSFLPDLK